MNEKNLIEILTVINSICSDSSLTGRYSNASKIIIATYNDLLDDIKLVLNDKILCKLSILNKLSENANMDEVGFASSVLLMLLKNCESKAKNDNTRL